MNESDTSEAAINTEGIPLKKWGRLALSTRWRTPEKSTIASRKPTPIPKACTIDSAKE